MFAEAKSRVLAIRVVAQRVFQPLETNTGIPYNTGKRKHGEVHAH